MPLPAGGWLVDLDLGCFGAERLVVGKAAGELFLSDVEVLGVATGRPGTCVERSALPAGVAYVEQAPGPGNRARFAVVVLRPENAGERIYRLGIHVMEPEKQKLFGVWSLDFPPGERLQRGFLEIDLGDRSSRAEINGRPRTPVTGSFDVAAGSFEGDAVWWQLTPLQQLLVERMLWFRRTEAGKVAVTKAVPAARITVIPSP